MTDERYRILELGELLQAGDECLRPWTLDGAPGSEHWVRLCGCVTRHGVRVDESAQPARRPLGGARDPAVLEVYCACKDPEMLDEGGRIAKALSLAVRFGGIDGAHHKDWVIDQMVRALTGCVGPFGEVKSNDYLTLVEQACAGEEGQQTYCWAEGIAP